MIDFSLDGELAALRDRVREFVAEVAIPAEPRDVSEHGLDEGLRAELQEEAREWGVFGPQIGAELGGLGLDHRGTAVILEECGYSLLGPQALHCAAPDEGNIQMLDRIADPEQRQRYLAPLAAGRIRSCFSMTEPAPGAGADPSMLRTRAERVDGGWSISGRKWFITGADGAAFTICMARAAEGVTMFLVDADNPGFLVQRTIEATDRAFPGGHGEVVFEDCRVGADAVLGEVGEGFRYAQVRLAPARLTHCERWLGAARRALDVALDRANQREAFGQKLGELGMVQEKLAESVLDIETSRAMIWRCAWALDNGEQARHESSLAKAHVAEAVNRVLDRSIQICGALGVCGDAPLARLMNELRPFRIYDGPTETHLWAIARRTLRERAAAMGLAGE
ncbi:MAG TPA: acyl-CoA dehydrogenase family protein [Solirubrobacterales bacterium]|jgi:acyl-CoA dehydrogenase|nr:acyl-CoA dehydrogenase family protein [Solirubrobacterales bacterium]